LRLSGENTINKASLGGAGKNEDEPGGIPAKKEQETLSKLLIDEGEFLTRLEETIGHAIQFFRIEPRSGRVVLSDEGKRMKVKDQIRLQLAGRYFAWKLHLVGTDKMNYREIAIELDRPPNGISPELSDLVREGDLVRDEDGLASMPFHRIDGTLRELEQSKAFAVTEGEPTAEPVRRNGSRKPAKMDPLVQSMLEKTVDLSEFAWVKNLKTARDKGLAALLIAKEKYGVAELTCPQMATFLTRTFPVKVTREAITMGLIGVKSEFVAPASRGHEITYTLLPPGREHILKAAADALNHRASADSEQASAESAS